MSRTIIRYLPGGQVRKIYSSGDRDRPGIAVVRRASYVEPQSRWLRLLFHVIRRLGGDDSRIACWTRSWPCFWRARMLVGTRPVLGPYRNRSDALRKEIDWLQENWILASHHASGTGSHEALG